MREETSCFEDVPTASHARGAAGDNGAAGLNKTKDGMQKIHPVPQAVEAPSESEQKAPDKEPKTFVERLKYVLFGKF